MSQEISKSFNNNRDTVIKIVQEYLGEEAQDKIVNQIVDRLFVFSENQKQNQEVFASNLNELLEKIYSEIKELQDNNKFNKVDDNIEAECAALDKLVDFYEQRGNYKKANKYLKEIITVRKRNDEND